MDRAYVIGIDSGGSYTRVVCAGLDGQVLAVARGSGGSPTHNADSEQQVRSVIRSALSQAGVRPGAAVGLAAGMAGLDSEDDLTWAEAHVGIDGLTCPRRLLNDAVVAHAGAFTGGPGIIVIAGTGSLILAVNEAGEEIRNYSYHHYAGGARHLAYDLMAHLLIDDDTQEDAGFVQEVLRYWDVADKAALRERLCGLGDWHYHDVKRLYGRLAPLITAAAAASPLADAACRRLASATAVGVRLLAAHFKSDVVPVSLHGGLATSPAFEQATRTALDVAGRPRLEVVAAPLSPLAGAALLALQQAGVATDDAVIERLAALT